MPIQSIVIHSTDGRKTGDIETLTGNKVSVHWYVTRKGEIFHFVNNADTAFHVGTFRDAKFSNSASLGIEQEHFDPDPENGRPKNEDWPVIQIQTVANLCALLFQMHSLSKSVIKSHAEAAAPKGRKQDPFGYPLEKLFQLIDSAMNDQWVAVNINDDED
ncbi:hypothetical protein GCM10028808_40090 [Spirosoma migulaei]